MNDYLEGFTGFTQHYTAQALQAVSKLIKTAQIKINGVYYSYPITKTIIQDDFYKHYFEVDSDPAGNIQRAVALDVNGVPLWADDFDIQKDDNGWHLAIKASLKHVANSGGNV